MPLRHERPSADYMRELRAVARAAASLREQLPTINLLPDGFPLEQVEGFCDSLVRLPNGTAEGSIGPLRAADSELNRIRQRFIPAYSEDDEEPQPLVARDGNLDLRLVSLMAAVRSAIERYKVEAGEELDTDVTPDLPYNPDAEKPTADAIAALDDAGRDVAHAEDVFATADVEVRRELETEQRLVSDSGTQAASTKAALSTESPRPTVIEWLEDGLSRTTTELEQRFEPYRDKIVAVGREVGDGLREIVEAWVPLVATLRIAATTTKNVVTILRSSSINVGEEEILPPDFDYV